MNAGKPLTERIHGIAGQRPLYTLIEYNTSNGRWLVDIKVLNPECPSQTLYSAHAEASMLETAITLAAQALAAKESEYDPKQHQQSRPRHLPSGYAWAYQLVVKPFNE